MNKNPVPKSEHAAAADAAAAKPAPATAKPAKAAAAAARMGRPPAAKAARVGRPPAAKKAVAVKKAVVRKSVKNTAAQLVAAKPAAAAKPVVAVKEKAKKAKLVRDSFTMPEVEYAVLGKVKKASLKAGFNVKKSELLRIGVALVDQLNTAQLQTALAALLPLKAGRPKQDK